MNRTPWASSVGWAERSEAHQYAEHFWASSVGWAERSEAHQYAEHFWASSSVG